jgi:hypothetical protein
VLVHLVFTADFANSFADLGGAGQGAALDALADAGELFLGGGQQVVAFAGAFLGQGGVAAGDEPFIGVVGVGDLG